MQLLRCAGHGPRRGRGGPAPIGVSAGRKAGPISRVDSVHPVLLASHGRQDLCHANSGHRAQFRTDLTMTSPLYNASIPVMQQMLRAMSDVLKKAEDHAAQKNIDPNALLQARLFPDMFPLVRQVQIAADFSKGIASRLAGAEVPSWPDTEVSFADLQALIAKALAHIGSFKPEQFDSSENREIVLRPGTPKEKKLTAGAYLLHYGLPQFFFHVTTTYAILRHNGVEVGKRDYMGAY